MARLVHGAIFNEIVTLSNAPFGARSSKVVATRLSNAQLRNVSLAAAKAGLPVGQYARAALVRLSGRGKDAASTLRDLIDVLYLPKDSQPEEVLAAVQAVVDAITSLDPPVGSDPLGQNVDVAPKALSASDRATAAKISDPKKRAAFVALRQKFTTPLVRVVQSKPKAKK